MSRNLDDLHPSLKRKALNVSEQSAAINIPILIYRTLATVEEQNFIYQQGRSRPGRIVSNAPGGFSYHNYGLAFDFAVDPPGPEIAWDTKVDANDDEIPDYAQVGRIGEDLGLEWGARFQSLRGDLGHLQMSCGLTVQQLLVFYEIGGLSRVWLEVDKVLESHGSNSR